MSRTEKIIICAILAVCAAAALIITLYSSGHSAKYAVISVDGEEVFRRALTKDGEFTVPEIPDMRFEISGGGVRVIGSDCPDKICIKTGLVTETAMSAVCLPNRVVVTVKGDDIHESQ